MGSARGTATLMVASGLLLVALLACKSKSYKCVAAVQVGDARYSSLGTGDSPAAAEKSARSGSCLAYCDYADPTLDAAWKRYKQTPKGQASKTSKSFDIFLNLKAEKATCVAKCGADMASGAAASKVECL